VAALFRKAEEENSTVAQNSTVTQAETTAQ
jgi:hypothetical protein